MESGKHMNRMEFCEQVRIYQHPFYITAQAILRNNEDAEDAVCSAILKGYEHLEQLRNPRKFKAWMIAIVRNEALRMKERRMELPGDDKIQEMSEPVFDSYNELWDIVQNLKEDYRMVIVLYYYNDLSIREIAHILEIPVGTVKSRLKRGRDSLKEALGKGEYDE